MTREEIENKANELYADNSFAYEGFLKGVEWCSKQYQWVRVDERLPELNERVLVAERGINKIMICIMKRIPYDSSNPDNKEWDWSLTNHKDKVIAWMPIPQLPQYKTMKTKINDYGK